MSEGVGHALEQALAYYRAPALLAKAPQRPLPDDVIELLRLAAGDDAQAAQSAVASGESPQRVVEAAVFFVQQVMFAEQADDYRVLGVNPGAPPARLREHFRWLIRWLHPDRNPDDWDSVYSDRVTRAWQSLRRGGALAGEGDALESSADLPVPSGSERAEEAQKLTLLAAARLARASRESVAAPPMVSARTARHLPAFVMGGLGLVAVSLVALMWYAQQEKNLQQRAAAASPVYVLPEAAPPAEAGILEPAPVVQEAAPAMDVALAEPVLNDPEPSVTAVALPDAALPVSAVREPMPLPAPMPPPAPRAAAAAASQPAPAVAAAPQPAPAAAAPAPAASVASSATAAQPMASAPAPAIEESNAHALLDQFAAAYAAGDLQALMRLFTRDASNHRGGREAIAYDYQTLFASSRERRITFKPNGWFTGVDDGTVLAGYETWVKEGRLLPGTTRRGEVRFTVRREDGQLKISRLIHG